MGGPPTQLKSHRLNWARRKRRRPEQQEQLEEQDQEDTIKVRKIRRKKRRQFFASQTSEADTSGASDSEAASESGFSEGGFITDPGDLSMLEEQVRADYQLSDRPSISGKQTFPLWNQTTTESVHLPPAPLPIPSVQAVGAPPSPTARPRSGHQSLKWSRDGGPRQDAQL